jgi:hypothetical protein
MQPKKARSQPPPRRSKALDDAQNAATQVLDRMEAPHQRHRGVDEIADHKIDLLTDCQLDAVPWLRKPKQLSSFSISAASAEGGLVQQVQEDARNGVSTTLFHVSKIR